jgi:Dolichyl-phosphate-mannose-protein mannosyltransferase
MFPTLFGAAFTLATAYALGSLFLRHRPAPPEIRLALGAAFESTLVFVLLLFHLAHWGAFLVMGVASMLAAWRFRAPQPRADAIRIPRPAWIVFAAYGAWYLVNALAPETLADGITYHLGLPAEYLRLGGFPDHPTFYELIPQGMEMLYTVAFSVGRHAAAKLVEFAFFLATVPLFFRIARRLGLPDLAALVAAVFYFCAPVAGLTGSSSYNDAAGVFFVFATLYLLLPADGRHPVHTAVYTGVLAGFCYAIKLPGAMVPLCAVLFVASQRRWRAALLITAGAALMIAPWMARDLLLTGNPFAPLMNAAFPNAFMHISTERELAANLRSLGNIAPAQVPWELAFGDRLTGTFGPLFFALPLGLFALRSRSGCSRCPGSATPAAAS